MATIGLNKASLLTAVIISALAIYQIAIGQTVSGDLEKIRTFGPMPIEKGMIISSRVVKLKSDVDSKVFDKWVNEYWNLEWQDLIPGFQSYIAKRDDGHSLGLYDYYLVFKAKNIKNPDFTSLYENNEWYREFFYYEPTKHLYDELFVYIEMDPFFKNIEWVEVK